MVEFALATFLLCSPPSDAAGPHPSVFVTPADVARVRQAVSVNKTFAAWADRLAQESLAAKISDLPRLERAWWETDRKKPWIKTYPQVYHHTWIVPERWAAGPIRHLASPLGTARVGEQRHTSSPDILPRWAKEVSVKRNVRPEYDVIQLQALQCRTRWHSIGWGFSRPFGPTMAILRSSLPEE